MVSKRGQGLPVNVIIVAALALIVLVVLVVIFTQQTTQFGQKVGEETKTELFKMRIFYGKCRPGEAFENTFLSDYEKAASDEEQDTAKSSFRSEVDRCKEFSDTKESCESESGCVWA
ncbi:MAG: hypothetical protein A2822_00010 [Candidatus Staskawiczbacteria bacterium RIFCSPHIGHO2_01_FULL_41_41]|uniref:Uncharacterized protein n=1 Tax=Candidatus Staskawiczbacteria bacterium RIFCSPHIGHO2_01_FULL_41_41 TaxID=1802203 RepID=A0A1G2HT88_9BACT|nr:MAG: hypothetical protein A2822_00010 [Candidatus Staskawiczbacteria bacterium RIFCSPHIGHO2_01_FULL_41_41]HLD79835.1 hypothetical protein [Candidatus Nanoarchaeia archaeon]